MGVSKFRRPLLAPNSQLDHSTAEQNTGLLWLDGKPIFRKTVSFAAGPNNSTVNTAHGITGLGIVVDSRGSMDNGTIQRSINSPELTAAVQAHYTITDTNLVMVSGVGGDYSAYSGFVVIDYTKA